MKYYVGMRVTTTSKAPISKQFKGFKKIEYAGYDRVSEHVWYDINGEYYRSDWLTDKR